MINLIVSAIVGIVVGILARYFYPGPVPMGMLLTMILGIAGSLLAGFVASRGTTGFHRAGFLDQERTTIHRLVSNSGAPAAVHRD